MYAALTDDPKDEEESDKLGGQKDDHRIQRETTISHTLAVATKISNRRNIQSKHGDPSHHPIDNKTRGTEVAAERGAKCEV